jgi:hypothetical protein
MLHFIAVAKCYPEMQWCIGVQLVTDLLELLFSGNWDMPAVSLVSFYRMFLHAHGKACVDPSARSVFS